MKIAAVIAEYNPFHNGHAWQIQKIRELSGADYVIVLMSGDFVQRGAPAVFSKYSRTEMALAGGADLVLELPVLYSCGSAQRFSDGAVSLLDQLGCVDELWFGSESGKIGSFLEYSAFLAEEPEEYQLALQAALHTGKSFPSARNAALDLCMKNDTSSFLLQPNNILGLEYCISLKRHHSKIKPHTLARKGCGYHDRKIRKDHICSASALRKSLLDPSDGLSENISRQIPEEVLPVFKKALKSCPPISENDFSLLLQYQLMQETPESLTAFLDVTEDLACRILHFLNQFQTCSQYASLLKTRNFTYTQISRAFFHILLGIRQIDIRSASGPAFIRILGLRLPRSGSPSLPAQLKKCCSVPLISTPSALPADAYSPDLFASNLYESIQCSKTGRSFLHEFQKSAVIYG